MQRTRTRLRKEEEGTKERRRGRDYREFSGEILIFIHIKVVFITMQNTALYRVSKILFQVGNI